MVEDTEYAPASNGRVTLGEVHRTALRIEDTLNTYIKTHAQEHKDQTEKLNSIDRWTATWGGRVIGLGALGTLVLGLLLSHVLGS